MLVGDIILSPVCVQIGFNTMNESKFVKLSATVFMIVLTAQPRMGQVTVRETPTSIPTYLVGNPEPTPYFFTGRTRQGAVGHVYPYPIYDNLDTSWRKNRKGSIVVDIHSRFCGDSSSDVIKAANFYIHRLIHPTYADTPSAREAFTDSLKLNPSDIWVKYYLSACK